MKTIFHLITDTYISEWEFITETELSVIGRNRDIEIALSKSEEGKGWFWTKEEGEKYIAKTKDIKDQIKKLEEQL